ncbi:type I polyketide synthase, partial [Saccharopolyspora sp. NPDC000995]
AHGTGTRLGDPIEAQALLATYGQDREHPLWLGSVKSNIGHTQAAAGVAGVIKMVMAMRHGVLPRTLHVEEPTTEVDWNTAAVCLLTQNQDWPDTGHPRRAGISSFGISGTNAHIIIEQPPGSEKTDAPRPELTAVAWVLSAKSPAALRAQARQLLAVCEQNPADIGWSLATSRAALDHRAAVVGSTSAALRDGLQALADGAPHPAVTEGEAGPAGKVVFVFPGQGSQWPGMGADLLDTHPVFTEWINRCEQALAPFVDWSLTDILRDEDAPLDRVDVVQPALWAMMIALAETWRDFGVEPAAVIGHSQGEIAAAFVAGILTLEDSARIVALRSQLIAQHLAGKGAMASIALPAEELGETLTNHPDITIAALNGPQSTVIAGPQHPLETLLSTLEQQDVRVRRIPVDYASHTAHVDTIQDQLLKALAPITPHQGAIPFHSTVTTTQLDGPELTADYWYRNLRQPVRFHPVVENLHPAHTTFIEPSPHPVLTTPIQETTDDATTIGALRRDNGSLAHLLTATTRAWTTGHPVDWTKLFENTAAQRIPLPTYPFQRTRYWLDAPVQAAPTGDGADADFWHAVEHEDLDALAAMLAVDDRDPREALRPALSLLSDWRRERVTGLTVDSWRYQVTWRPLAPPSSSPTGPGRYLALVPAQHADSPSVTTVLGALAAAGAEITCAGAQDRDSISGQLAEHRPQHVLSFLAFADDAVSATLALLQACADADLDGSVWCVTSGAVSVGRADRLRNPDQAAVWGLGQVAGLEHPQWWSGLVDLLDEPDERAAARIAAVLTGAGEEDQLAVRASGVFVRRLAHAAAPSTERRWSTDGPVLITGGTGALGAHVARWLARSGVQHLVLTSRRGIEAPGAQELRAELEALAPGVRVDVETCDVADRAALDRVLDALDTAVTAVFHTAGVGTAASLRETGSALLAQAWEGKALGAKNLDDAFADTALDAFVLFSSAAGVWGGSGQGAYAAANAYLDALAQARRDRGLHALATAWGTWGGDGMAAQGAARDSLHRSGLPAMEPELAVEALRRALDVDDTSVAVADIAWNRFAPTLSAARRRPLISDLAEARAALDGAGADGPEAQDDGWRQRLSGLTSTERNRALLDLVRAEVAAVLGHCSPAEITPRAAFRDLGLDSLTAVQLRNRLKSATGLALPTTLVFDHPSPVALVAHLERELLGEVAPAAATTETAYRDDDPVVIVAMSCRLPGGADSPESLWDLVTLGGDAVSGFPTDRGWNVEGIYDPGLSRPGTSYAREGAFVPEAAEFDAEFFGISPREAVAMDPQQRLLLETSWEAFERAGIAIDGLRESRTGVFVGASTSHYETHDSARSAEGYLITGTATAVLSGRISYTFGLEGPAVTVDTACSSSLVALHLAAQALRSGECCLALAGGVTVMSTPAAFVEFSRQRGLAADGRCKAFAAAADGTGWGEGAGIVLLERLSDARRNGHPVLAVLRGSAVNQDGASNGLSAPNGPSQQRVIRQALANAGLHPSEVDAVEGHGTGTRLGDPIEAQALLATYGQDREHPLWLGSVKSNIGHTQSAAGVAGVIKMVMAMRHGLLPRTLHVDEPTPHVDWASGEISLLIEDQPWPEVDRPRRVGVSAFGVGGTNAHVIIEQATEPEPLADTGTPPPVVPWVLSARDESALSALAGQLARRVGDDASVLDIGYSLATTRIALEERAVLIGGDVDERRRALAELAEGRVPPGVIRGRVAEGGLVMVFSGQGTQRLGMGRELYDAYPVYAEAFDTTCTELDLHLPRPLHEVVFGDDPDLLDQTQYTQPALFAFQTALYRLWESWGITPEIVTGHSIGEITAAHIAGVLTLTDAATLITTRGRLMQSLPAGGAMVAINAAESEVLPQLAGFEDEVGIAAINGPNSLVLSGDHEALATIAQGLKHRTTWLRVSHAFHSPLMNPILDEFRTTVENLTFAAPTIPLVSTVTGQPADHRTLADPEHWIRHARQTVRFADATAHIEAAHLEIGPTGSLIPHLPAGAIASLRSKQPETQSLATALASVVATGADPDWHAYFAGTGARAVALPTYPFQRRHYWLDGTAPTTTGEETADESETRFWDAVERQDLSALSQEVGDDHEALTAALPVLADWRRRKRDQSVVDSWRYRVSWTPLRAPAQSLAGTWLAVVPESCRDDAEIAAVLGALRDGGADVRVVHDAEVGDCTGLSGVLSLLAFDERPDEQHPPLSRGITATIALIHQLQRAGSTAPLWCATRGAVAIGHSEQLRSPVQAQIWGAGRAVALEWPQSWGGLIDLPPTLDERVLSALPALLAGSGGEDQLALRSSGVLARRLVRAPHAAPSGPEWTPRGTVLITGGTGALGAHVARWLARRGAEHLLLVSRRGPAAPGVAALEAELSASGADVTIAACDVADRASLAELLAGIPQQRPLTAVVHTAGVGQRNPLSETGIDEFAEVVLAKTAGATHLDELTGDRELDAFVLFSSVSATWGSGGQAAYGAANAYLDALARRRRDRGLTATSVAWGPWDDGGMAEGAAGEHSRRRGLVPLPPGPAISALEQTVREADPCLTVADVRWDDFLPLFVSARPSPLLSGLPESRRVLGSGQETDTGPAHRLAALGPAERRSHLLSVITVEAAAVLGHATPDGVEPDRAFRDLGFDSLTAVELRNRLGAALGIALPATMVFDHPTPHRLVSHLCSLFADEPREERNADTAVEVSAEPLAIVGMGCRFPGGVHSPDQLWELVRAGRDAVSGFPTDRGWDLGALLTTAPGEHGGSTATEGGFLHEMADFDAAFFGIFPREALAMDPQQRLLLETAWETFERSGIDPASLHGSRTGVFVGGNSQDYVSLLHNGAQGTEGYLLTGNTTSVASGRISYTFGLEGPAVTVDTACSSSLVALHLAAQALRNGECTMALAGGVTVMSTPRTFTEFSRQGGLAADGRCKAFSSTADGTGWGEGVGLILVERLSDARRNNHPVLAIVRGSAINQDGASNGLTAPNGLSQQGVIRQALANAGLRPSEVDVVEAHGTGTRLGDPIEAQALLATYGQDRDHPLWLGSIKSNIGHTQSAAGVAGVIKMVMAMQHGLLPRTLHVDEPTGEVDWAAGAVALLTEDRAWPEHPRPRRAGVSSFGVSGTNAHVILEQAPALDEPDAPGPDLAAAPWVLSGRTESAVRAQAARLAEQLADDASVVDTAWSLATTRAAFEERAVVVTGDLDERRKALQTFAEGQAPPEVITGRASEGGLVMVFSGQGTQRLAMGRELYDTYPAYADAFDTACTELDPHLPHPLRDVIFGDDPNLLNQTQYAQPALFAFQTALYRLWESWGITPEIVTGHSIGEITAAHITGVLTLTDAVTLIAVRGRLMQSLPEGGAMVAINATENEILPHLAGYEDEIGIAAVNGPGSLVLSGDQATLREITDSLSQRRTTWLRVSHAFHSPLMNPILDEFRTTVENLTFAIPNLPLVSTVTGDLAAHQTLTNPEHWIRHARNTVRFADAITTIAARNPSTHLEIGPNAALIPHLPTGAIASLRGKQPEAQSLATALARLVVNGINPDWRNYFNHINAHPTPLPTYPFQRTRYWPDAVNGSHHVNAAHPLLTNAVELAHSNGVLLTARLSTASHPWLADHVVAGSVVFPGAAFVELVLHATQQAGLRNIEELTLENPLLLPENDTVEVQVAVAEPDRDGRRAVTVHSRTEEYGDAWQLHATGVIDATPVPEPSWSLAAWPPPEAVELPVAEVYAEFAAAGLDYGPFFQGLRSAWRAGEDVAVEVALPSGEEHHAAGFGLHPALLDSVLHGTGIGRMFGADDQARLPFSWSGVTYYAAGAPVLRALLSPKGEDAVAMRVADAAGRPVAAVDLLTMRKITPEKLANTRNSLLVESWQPRETPATATTFAVLGDEHEPEGATHLLLMVRNSDSPEPDIALTTAATVLSAIQSVTDESTLVVLTSKAVAVDAEPAPAGAAVWGLVRAAQAERPGRVMLVDTDDEKSSWDALPHALTSDEPQLALRRGKILVPRLVPATAAVPSTPDWSSSTILITGASGALGRLVARHLVDAHGVRDLVLLSRAGDAPEPAGAAVTHIACDLTDQRQISEALAVVPRDRPLTIVHCAGTLDDATIEHQTPERLQRTFAPKATAAWHLHQHTQHHPTTLILFSSAAATLGSPGQTNYAAANAYLHALTHLRTSHHQPTTTIAWGPWTTGMTHNLTSADRRRIAETGLIPIDEAHGLALFDAALAGNEPVVLPLPVNRAALCRRAADGPLPAVLRNMAPPPVRAATAAPTMTQQALADTLRGLPAHEQDERLAQLVRGRIAAVLGHGSPEAVPMDQQFTDLGFDSLMSVELRGALEAATGLRLPATLVFDHPTPAGVHELLHGELLSGESSAPEAVFAEIDRLETNLARLGEQHAARVRSRIWSLLAAWEDTGTGVDTGSDDELADADLEATLGIIDDELGRSDESDAK